MLNFSEVKCKEKLTVDFILSRVSEAELWFHYMGKFELNKSFKYPFTEDKNPSGVMVMSKSGNILLYHFTSGKTMNIFHFVKQAFNENFDNALKRIARDFGLIDKSTYNVSEVSRKQAIQLEKQTKEETLIQFTYKAFTLEALKYWSLFEISKNELLKDEIYQIDKVWINKYEIKNPEGYLRFAKCEKYDDKIGVKIYSPENKNMKWLSSIPLTIPFGMNNLKPTENRIFVQKSFKDMLCLKKWFGCVIAAQSENPSAITPELITKLDKDYDVKYAWYDCDPPGLKSLSVMEGRGFVPITTDLENYEKHKIKDVADTIKTFGVYYFEDYLKKINLI